MMRTGQCLCGEVKFVAEAGDTFNICYCKMCQRWSAGAFMGVPTTHFEITEGEDFLTVMQTSDWADRAFCKSCGSNIYYHARNSGSPTVTLGNLDDASGLVATKQYYFDNKPDGFTILEETLKMTEAECIAHFAPDETGEMQ